MPNEEGSVDKTTDGLTPELRRQLSELENIFGAALAKHEAGHLEEAKPLYEAVLRILPRHSDSLHLYGTLLHQQNLNQEAESFLRQAILLSPGIASYYNHLGSVFRALGNLDRALLAFQIAVKIRPNNPEAFLNLAITFEDKQHPEAALEAARLASWLTPDDANCRLRLGVLLQKLGSMDEALRELLVAQTMSPLVTETYLHLAIVYRALENNIKTLISAQRGIILSPGTREVYPHLSGSINENLEGFDCLSWASRAIYLKPLDSKLWSNLAAEYNLVFQFKESVDKARRAIILDPTEDLAYNNLGVGLYQICKYSDAVRFARSGHIAFPYLAELEFVLSQSAFAIRDYDLAWHHWPSRYRLEEAPQRVGLPPKRWDGKLISEDHLLLCSEQGIGDEIMFLSCLPDLLETIEDVTLECETRWHSIFKRTFPSITLVSRQVYGNEVGNAVYDYRDLVKRGDYKYYAFHGDLPAIFRRDLDKQAPRGGYLKVDDKEANYWSQRLSSFRHLPVIGICWRSGLDLTRKRSFYYPDVLELFSQLPYNDCVLVSLQYGEYREEIESVRSQLGVVVHDFPELDQTHELDRVAALMSCLDLAIAPSTTVCHLACAVGIPTIGMDKSNFDCINQRDPLFSNLLPVMDGTDSVNTSLAAKRTSQALSFFLRHRKLPIVAPGNS